MGFVNVNFGISRLGKLPLLSALCLLLCTTSAGAASYEILAGELSFDGGRRRALSGSFDVSPFATGSSASGSTPLSVNYFALRAGERSFTPNEPVEFQGHVPVLFLELADQIQLLGDDVGLLRMRSGGALVASGEAEATFRFLDFRSGPSGGGHAVGHLGESVLPRRLELTGTLYEVDQTFRLEGGLCLPPPVTPPHPGGGVIQIVGGGNVEIVGGGNIEIVGGGNIEIVGGDNIDGELSGSAGVFGSTGAGPTVTLDELGIAAPDGAVVLYDHLTGALTVSSEGDLFIEGTAIEVPGLTSLTIRAEGGITITGTLSLPVDVVLHLEAKGTLDVIGEIEAPGGVSVPAPEITPVPICFGLRAVFPAQERAVGSFSLVATAARPMEIDVEPRRRRNLVLPAITKRIRVAILGSDDLDVRDIDETTLRLGAGEAEPAPWRTRRPTRRGFANRDRQHDLITSFGVGDAEIAFGDTTVCLLAQTRDGEILEGCDAIQTLPRRLRSTDRLRSR